MKKSSGAIRYRQWTYLGVAVAFALVFAAWRPAAFAQGAACVGDCADDGEVTVDDILKMVNISLGLLPIEDCENGDATGDGEITVEEIIQAVNNAQGGCPMDMANCGDGQMVEGEECDDGGICTGGAMAGTVCDAEADCGATQPGVCIAGPNIARACMANTDCPASVCVRCKSFGGDGCAANCTLESDVAYVLKPGIVAAGSIVPGTSGATVFGEIIPKLPLPLTGMQVLTVGKERNGQIPLVIKAPSVEFPQIPVSNIACACVRGFDVRTCGGVLFELGGATLAPICNDPNAAYDCAANSKPPCSTVHGPGNSASGVIGCNGLEPVDVSITQDCNGEAGGEPFPPVVVLSGAGPAGSAIVLNTISIGTQVGMCTPTFCTEADPPSARGTPQTLPYTTGSATSLVQNANDFPGFDIGPQTESGSEFTCSGGTIGSVTDVSLAGAFTACDQPTIADIVVTNTLIGQ